MSPAVYITAVTFRDVPFTITATRSDGSEETVAADSERAKQMIGETFGRPADHDPGDEDRS